MFTTVAPPDIESPSQPQNLASPGQTGSTIDLVWDAATDNWALPSTTSTGMAPWSGAMGVAVYNIYRDGTLVGSESEPSHTATGLTPGTSYVWTPRITSANGSPWPSAPAC